MLKFKGGLVLGEDVWRVNPDSGPEFVVPLKDNSLAYALYINNFFAIKKVIFNDPATIVLWSDGTKTVVKCGKDDMYDKEKGLALCFMKKALGNKCKGRYNNTFKKYIKENKDGKNEV